MFPFRMYTQGEETKKTNGVFKEAAINGSSAKDRAGVEIYVSWKIFANSNKNRLSIKYLESDEAELLLTVMPA